MEISDIGDQVARAFALEEEEEAYDLEKGQGRKKSRFSALGKQDDPPAPNRKASPGGRQLQAPTCTNQRVAGALPLGCLLCKHPHLLTAPLILFCLITALCSFGIVHATNDSYDLEEKQARDAAVSAADGIAKQLSSASRAALSMAAVVRMNPNWSFLESNFEVLAKELFRQSNEEGNLFLRELALIPFGRVSANYGTIHDHHTHTDLFSPERIESTGPYRSMEQRGLTVNGPIPFTNTEERAFAARYPVFFNDSDEDESWGHPDNITHPTGCPGPPCYNPATREKFWGFIGGVVSAEPLLAGDNVHLEKLLSDDLSYSLTTSFLAGTNGPGTLVSRGPKPDKVTASCAVDLPGTSWVLSVYSPRLDEIVQLRKGLLALVVVAAFILSGLLLLLLLCSKRASVLLQEQLVTNKLLQEEKVSREALLGRQLDLLACFEQTTRRTRNLSRSKLTEGQIKTLDQIATARAAIADVRRSMDDDVSVQELLAEGSFGKVYRGKWRGTDVAVKIIMLPGNMSGREKREKMVVWEAAISSSLIHPNVCQTYHYRIKPVKESAKQGLETDKCGSAMVSSDLGGSSCTDEVHSYEVQLVLEYCDRSSLRDALDAGLFLTPDGVNYAAQLECAMDVAKAMLHLHCNNVLHLDLKTRNILLASSGAEGKGVTCKVSDFGLSVRMDHLETHVSSLFHGTLTHMAPEVMLEGTCSKASDVYAFGIVLWELFTCDYPFRDVPPALLGHSIVKQGQRPAWPSSVPKGYRDLANACWDQNPDARPTFEVILEELHRLRKGLGIPAPPLQAFPMQQFQSRQPHLQEDRTLLQPSSQQLQTRDSRNFLQTKGPSTPSQAELLHTKDLSASSQAQSQTSASMLEQALEEGASSASLAEEDEEIACSSDHRTKRTGEGGLTHPQLGSLEGDNESFNTSSMSSRSMRGLLTTSELCDLQAQQTSPTNKPNISQDPGARPVPLLHSLHADVPCANSDGFGSSSFSKGAIFPLSFTGPSQRQLNAEGMENGDTREPQLVCGVEEGSNGQAGHPKVSESSGLHSKQSGLVIPS